MQKMMTKALESKVPALYAQDGKGSEAIIYAHYFSCFNGWDWYMTEYDPETREAFGIVKGFETEMGYFSIEEFESINRSRGFNVIERDLYWRPQAAGTIL